MLLLTLTIYFIMQFLSIPFLVFFSLLGLILPHRYHFYSLIFPLEHCLRKYVLNYLLWSLNVIIPDALILFEHSIGGWPCSGIFKSGFFIQLAHCIFCAFYKIVRLSSEKLFPIQSRGDPIFRVFGLHNSTTDELTWRFLQGCSLNHSGLQSQFSVLFPFPNFGFFQFKSCFFILFFHL